MSAHRTLTTGAVALALAGIVGHLKHHLCQILGSRWEGQGPTT